MSGHARLTMLNDMAADNFVESLDKQRQWGIYDLDLRMKIQGHSIGLLPVDVAQQAVAEIEDRSMRVHAFSTAFLVGDVRMGRQKATEHSDQMLSTTLAAAEILRPTYIRILAGQWPGRPAAPGAVDGLLLEHNWVFDEYRRVADAIASAGWTPILENEASHCFLSHPDEMVQFLTEVNHPELRFTWDIQNQWATGVYPTMAHLDQLEPYISYYHVKGAAAGERPFVARWNASLADSTWPVVEITQAVVDRGLSEVICLNPTQHGADLDNYDYSSVLERDLEFLRSHVTGIQ